MQVSQTIGIFAVALKITIFADGEDAHESHGKEEKRFIFIYQ